MNKLIFVIGLTLGALALATFSAPLSIAIAQGGDEHEMINGVVQKVDKFSEQDHAQTRANQKLRNGRRHDDGVCGAGPQRSERT